MRYSVILVLALAGCCGPNVPLEVAESAQVLCRGVEKYVEHSKPGDGVTEEAHRDLGDILKAAARKHAELALRGAAR